MAKIKGQFSENFSIDLKVDDKFAFTLDSGHPSIPNPKGASPGSVLGVALAACKAMVAQSYLLMRRIEGDVSLVMDTGYITESDRSQSFKADLKIVVDADLDEMHQEALQRQLAEKCTVEQILLSDNNQIATEVIFK